MEGKIIFLVQHFWEFDIHKKKIQRGGEKVQSKFG